MKKIKEKRFYTVGEAAELLGVSVQTIHRWDEEEKLKVMRTLGKHRRIPLEEIERLLEMMEG